MYIARHYVNVNGKMFTPGEVITEKITEEKERFLMGHDAISKVEDAAAPQESEHAPNPEQASGEPDNDGAPALPEDNDAADEETEGEEEAPEIDVTDGIVTEPEPEEAPAASTSKRSSKKK